MKLAHVAVFLLVSVSSSRGQAPSGSLSFPGTSNTSTFAHFGINNPGFPDTSTRITIYDSVPTSSGAIGTLPNAYPVQPSRFGSETLANSGFSSRTGQGRFIIAFKDRTIDLAILVWIQGDTLRYLNLQDVYRIIPLKRIDWKATKNLNPSGDQSAIFHLAK